VTDWPHGIDRAGCRQEVLRRRLRHFKGDRPAGLSGRAAIFDAFLGDAHHTAEGMRLAAVISIVLAVLGTFVIWHLGRR
jgi:hypothetical protein